MLGKRTKIYFRERWKKKLETTSVRPLSCWEGREDVKEEERSEARRDIKEN